MSLTVTIIQSQLYWEDKIANLQQFEEKIHRINLPTEVVILPEMFNTGFSMQPELLAETMEGTSVAWMRKMAMQKRIILTGSLMIQEANQYYNRLIWMLPNGQYGYYDKRHCFAFAGEHEKYTAGNKRFIAQVKGWKINLQICYDLRFPVWARQQKEATAIETLPGVAHSKAKEVATAEYDVLIYVANWPERRNHAWKTLLTARAIENQAYVIGVNRVGYDGNEIYHSGNSMVVDAMGEVLYHQQHDEDIFTITLEKEKLEQARTQFPFWKEADYFRIMNDV